MCLILLYYFIGFRKIFEAINKNNLSPIKTIEVDHSVGTTKGSYRELNQLKNTDQPREGKHK